MSILSAHKIIPTGAHLAYRFCPFPAVNNRAALSEVASFDYEILRKLALESVVDSTERTDDRGLSLFMVKGS